MRTMRHMVWEVYKGQVHGSIYLFWMVEISPTAINCINHKEAEKNGKIAYIIKPF